MNGRNNLDRNLNTLQNWAVYILFGVGTFLILKGLIMCIQNFYLSSSISSLITRIATVDRYGFRSNNEIELIQLGIRYGIEAVDMLKNYWMGFPTMLLGGFTMIMALIIRILINISNNTQIMGYRLEQTINPSMNRDQQQSYAGNNFNNQQTDFNTNHGTNNQENGYQAPRNSARNSSENNYQDPNHNSRHNNEQSNQRNLNFNDFE